MAQILRLVPFAPNSFVTLFAADLCCYKALRKNGSALPEEFIKCTGVTPGTAGVYQINLLLTASLGANPEIRVVMDDQASREGGRSAGATITGPNALNR